MIWFADVIFYRNIFASTDLARYFYPLREFGTSLVKELCIPLWNPYILCGTPFLAALQTNVFYPLSVIYYLSPSFNIAFNLYIIFHFIFAGVFMYSLMKYWRYSYTACIISAFVFTFGGYLTSVITMNTTMSSFIWTPLILLFFDRALRRYSISSAILCGVFLAIQFLGGNPDLIYGTIWLIFFYMVGYAWVHRKEGYGIFVKAFIYFIVANIVWILIDAVQILPTLELLLHSERLAGSRFETITKWSMYPTEIFSFIIPYIRGNISVMEGPFDPQKWLISFYVGIGALVFSITGLFIDRKKRFVFFWLVLTASIILALGRFTPLYSFLYNFIPGFKHVRYPVKFLYLGAISFSVLAGMGYEMIVTLKNKAKRQSITSNLLRINVFFAIVLGLFFIYWDRIMKYVIKMFGRELESTIHISRKIIYTFLSDSMYIAHSFIMLTLITILITAFYNRIVQKKTFSILVLCVVFLGLYNVNAGLTRTSSIDLFIKPPESVNLIKQDKGLFRMYQTKDIWQINRRIYGWNYPLAIHERKGTFMCNSSMQFGISDIFGYDSLLRKIPLDFMFIIRDLPIERQYKIVGLLNGLYIISLEPVGGEVVYKGRLSAAKVLYKDASYEHFYILKNPYFMERAFLSERETVPENKSDILGIFKIIDFDPRKVVILTEEPLDKHKILYSPEPMKSKTKNPASREYVEILSYKPEKVIIEAYVNTPKWLVLSDSYYPGWKVFIDGKEDKIYEANYLMRAVYLDRGKHLVEFKYEPFSFKLGSVISLVTLLGLGCIGIVKWIKRDKENT